MLRWAEEAQGDEELLSMLRASAADRSRSWLGKRRVRPSSSPFLVRQIRKYLRFSAGMCAAGLRAGIAFLFPTSGRFGQTIKVAVLQWLGLL